MISRSPIVLNALSNHDTPCVEPVKRMVEGRFGWAVHRFPIKGGKTLRETVYKELGELFAENLYATASRRGFMVPFIAQAKASDGNKEEDNESSNPIQVADNKKSKVAAVRSRARNLLVPAVRKIHRRNSR